MIVDDAEEASVDGLVILELDPILQSTQVIAQVNGTGWLNTREDHLSDHSLRSTVDYACNRVMSLQDGKKKMSKSDKSTRSCINLVDGPEQIRNKIRRAKTDSYKEIKYRP